MIASVVNRHRRRRSVAQLKTSQSCYQKPLELDERDTPAWTQRPERHDRLLQLSASLEELGPVHKPIIGELLTDRQTDCTTQSISAVATAPTQMSTKQIEGR